MRESAEKDNSMAKPGTMVVSSFHLTNGTLITPLVSFYLELAQVCTKGHRFVENFPRNCLHTFVQCAIDALRQGDENSNTSVVAETKKLLANSSYGYQIMDPSQQSVTKYTNDEKTHSATTCKMFEGINPNDDQP